ncbi:hypothetical protein H6P81_016461 [Aristolochia fimbriata]|uniref:Uncharacterized protein n=1 Tax=Aristolochia fimbriata TaxID=158543 RepID=A0AAV7EBA6_ARIFI|nr:hypothetical protein H6P81_016461 [Aristolochia fimbriata]
MGAESWGRRDFEFTKYGIHFSTNGRLLVVEGLGGNKSRGEAAAEAAQVKRGGERGPIMDSFSLLLVVEGLGGTQMDVDFWSASLRGGVLCPSPSTACEDRAKIHRGLSLSSNSLSLPSYESQGIARSFLALFFPSFGSVVRPRRGIDGVRTGKKSQSSSGEEGGWLLIFLQVGLIAGSEFWGFFCGSDHGGRGPNLLSGKKKERTALRIASGWSFWERERMERIVDSFFLLLDLRRQPGK